MSDRKGLSILIPIFNYDVCQLVQSIYQEGKQNKFDFEILCYDDGSSENFKKINQKIFADPLLKYKELPFNIGRAKIRNMMAAEAEYNNLLFLDCDSGINNNTFLQNYSYYFDHKVVVGGRIYSDLPPADAGLFLHWLAGKKKEEKNSIERAKTPYANFMFNNIMVHKDIYSAIQLDENIKGYGHEDSKFGYALKEKNIPVTHIDNPIVHVGLDKNTAFIDKTKEAVRNLKILTAEGYARDTKLYKYYTLLKKFGLVEIIKPIIGLLNPAMKKNLLSAKPSLLFLDLFKLGLFMEETKKN